MPPLPHSPAPIDNVVAVFGLILGIAVARTLPQLVSFYSWFSRSGLKIAEHRGYGQTACKMFGFIPAPKLSVVTMAFSGASFLALVLAPIGLPASMRAPALGLALVAYHLYFSQVYCEAHVGAHVTALIPPALILLALCPALDGDLPPIAAAQTAAFTCWLMKIVLTSAYCGAGLCKISKSFASLRRGGSSWCTGSTLQAWEAQGVGAQKAREASADAAKGYGRYGTQAAATPCDAGCNPMRCRLQPHVTQAFIFEAMLLSTPQTRTSFGVPTPLTHALQRLHVLRPRLLLLPASVAAVCFETLAPLLLLAPPHLASVPFALAGLSFHYGIALLQNIDFVSWWAPASTLPPPPSQARYTPLHDSSPCAHHAHSTHTPLN